MFSAIITWLTSKVGSKLARPLVIGGLILLLVLVVFLVGRCTTGDDTDGAQIEQSNSSSNAIADAAADAIKTFDERTATEDAIDKVVSETVSEIEAAPDADAVRSAVLAGVCSQQAHMNDPACTTRAETRR